MTDAVLTINAGSSSIKFGVFETTPPQKPVAHGNVERIGSAPHFEGFDETGQKTADKHWEDGAELSHEALLEPILRWAESHLQGKKLVGVGHRIVHGGTLFSSPVRLDPDIIIALERLTPLAPLHQPHNLAPVNTIKTLRPDLPQIACFDTAFHHGMPELATWMPLPARYYVAGVRRYGFHGLSYEFIASRFAQLDPINADRRIIAAHLGNGASACAMFSRKSIGTSMGFTALDGLMMGTRTGALDPGVLLYMMEQEKLTAAKISHLLYHESGLLGVSCESSDMRSLLASSRAESRRAVALFCYRAACEIASLTVAIGGLDALIFTAGVGENAAPIRQEICQALAHLGISLDEAANIRHERVISDKASKVAVWVIPTDEEAMIARHTIRILGC